MNTKPESTASGVKRTSTDLRRELARLTAERDTALKERDEALEQQTATAELLKVMSRSTLSLQQLLDTVVETAVRLCRAELGHVALRDGNIYRAFATFALEPEFAAFVRGLIFKPGRETLVGRVLMEGEVVQMADTAADPEYALPEIVATGHIRAQMGVPLGPVDDPFGVFVLCRKEAGLFTDSQVELIRTFADQAAIAIENARLIAETQEALAQQTATAEVLGVINASPGDLAPVFEAILDKAHILCDAAHGHLSVYEGKHFRSAATHAVPEGFAALLHEPFQPGLDVAKRLLAGEMVIHIPDMAGLAYEPEDRIGRGAVELAGVRTLLIVALRKDATLLGYLTAHRTEVQPFTDKQIALLQNFAAQAVIAMENARLLGDLRQRTGDLQEALEYQTATSDVLKVISHSTLDLLPVLQTLVETAVRLCRADFGHLDLPDDGAFRPAAALAFSPEFDAVLRRTAFRPDEGTTVGRVLLGRQTVHVADVTVDPSYSFHEAVTLGNVHAVLGVPLLRGEEIVGVFALGREQPGGFTERQIELVRTFADQAVIAIENARLLGEIRQRQAELQVTFDNMADGVAMFDQELRLTAWNRNFQELLQLPDALLSERPAFDTYVRYLTERGEFGQSDAESEIVRLRSRLADHYSFERTRPDGTVLEVRHNPMPDGGFVLIYSDITERKRSEEEVRAARDAAEAAYADLKAAQASLVQAEKMASLGQLTAGIAHEIKNPLNFVNNFASLSVELLDELKEATGPAMASLGDDKRAEVDETMVMLTGNLEKIAEHGKRADNIVKSMLEHSRGVSGERREVDLNGVIEEALNLAYHGARAQDQSFNITLERDYAASLKPIELAPQEMTRVFLNLFGNGFYAANKRAQDNGDGSFRPVLTVKTREDGGAVEVTVRDNGTGIPPEIKDRLFQPFFTTKPTGEGTGLGLSISYDIVTQQHGGTITVESEPGAYTEFTVRLPRH